MRRMFMVLRVTALMAAMMVSASPAQANDLNFRNSNNFVQFGNSFVGIGDIDGFDFDDIDFGRHHCCHHLFGNNGIIFSAIDQDSRSGDITIG